MPVPLTSSGNALKIINVRHLLGAAHWPDACACCGEAAKTRIPLDTRQKSSVEMIPYCTVCERHPDYRLTNPSEIDDLLSDSDAEAAFNKAFVPSSFPRPAGIRRSCTAFTRTVSLKKRYNMGQLLPPTVDAFPDGGIQFIKAVIFVRTPIPALIFTNLDYAKRFAEENELNWEEIIKENEPPPESSTILHLLKLARCISDWGTLPFRLRLPLYAFI